MTAFRYRAAAIDGSIVRGILDAAAESEARASLYDRGLAPIEVRRDSAASSPWGGHDSRQLAVAFRSLADLVSAGMPLDQALQATAAVCRPRLAADLVAAREMIARGEGLAAALANGRIPQVVTGTILAGERGGRLDEALSTVANQLEVDADLGAAVRQALTYPMLLLVAGVTSVFFIGLVVVPRFAGILADLGQQLPPATALLLSGSMVLREWGWLGLGVGTALLLSLLHWYRTPPGRARVHRLLLGCPVIGKVRLALATSRVAGALAGMLRSGLPILQALEAASAAAGDTAVADRLRRVGQRVAGGAELAKSLGSETALSPIAVQLIAVGERTGRLGEMCRRAADIAGQDGRRALARTVGLLEPGLVVVFGGIVAWVALALLQAVYSVRPG